MPNAVEDNVAIDDTLKTGDGGIAPEQDKADTSKFFENFETADDLKKAYKELQQKLGQQGSELGELRSAIKAKEQEDRFAQVTEKLSSLIQDKKNPEINWKEYSSRLGGKMAEQPQEATVELAEAVSNWIADDTRKVQTFAEQKVKALEQTLAAIVEKMETMDDDYKAHKGMIDKFVAEGMSITKAKKLAKEVIKDIPSMRNEPPVNVSPTRVVQTAKKSEPVMTAEDIALLKAQGSTDAEIEMLKAKWERDRSLTEAERKRF